MGTAPRMAGIAPGPHAAALLEVAIVVVALACGAAGAVATLRARAVVCSLERALRADRAHAAAYAGAARRLAGAARDSVAAVREEIARAVRALAPAVDGVLLYEEHGGELVCVAAFGARFAYYAGSRAALDDTSSLPARAFAAGHHVVQTGMQAASRPSGGGAEALAVRAHADRVHGGRVHVGRVHGGRVHVDRAHGWRVHAARSHADPVHPGDASAFAVPLALDAGRGCVLVAASQSEPFEGVVVQRLVALAEHASFAYLIALERENDRRSAEYDGLTGLLTPRAFRQRLAGLVERTRFVPPARLALVFVDTDRFKCWNDRYGHAAGDALLRELARVLRSAAPAEHDLVARNGGDEFCIVLADAGKAAAIERAEHLRQRIAAIDFSALRPTTAGNEDREGASPAGAADAIRIEGASPAGVADAIRIEGASPAGASDAIRISASIGVAALPADASSASELLERADAAMYHSKQTGRDGVSYLSPDGAFVRMPPPTQ